MKVEILVNFMPGCFLGTTANLHPWNKVFQIQSKFDKKRLREGRQVDVLSNTDGHKASYTF